MNGNRRKFDNGYIICDKDVRVMIHHDCVTVSANTVQGILIMSGINDYLKDVENINVFRDVNGDIHMIEVEILREISGN